MPSPARRRRALRSTALPGGAMLTVFALDGPAPGPISAAPSLIPLVLPDQAPALSMLVPTPGTPTPATAQMLVYAPLGTPGPASSPSAPAQPRGRGRGRGRSLRGRRGSRTRGGQGRDARAQAAPHALSDDLPGPRIVHGDISDDPFANPANLSTPRTPTTAAVVAELESLITPSPVAPCVVPHDCLARPAPSPSGPAGNKHRHSADDVWSFYETKDGYRTCLFCSQRKAQGEAKTVQMYSTSTGTGGLRRHLFTHHLDTWVSGCDQMKIDITADEAQDAVRDYRHRYQQVGPTHLPRPGRHTFTDAAFVDAIAKWIVADDQSINVIESKELHEIFLMLRAELRDQDIPGRTTIRKRILELWDMSLDKLETEMNDSLGKISSTMDMWSDPNLTPYMAATAHWIEGKLENTPSGPQYSLKLRADLIAFHRVPGRHTGEHLAVAFVHIINRLAIQNKIGWITVDNAANNNTFLAFFAKELHELGITFDPIARHIRCFPHIVNLACQAILSAITDMELAKADDSDMILDANNIPDAFDHDPIATIRTLVRVIRSSSLRRQYFSEILKTLRKPNLQLLRDMAIRWSSTLLMIERASVLKDAIDRFVISNHELQKYQLSTSEWVLLAEYRKILEVPHAFQQRLSAEKTPTLSGALSSFAAMMNVWEGQKVKMPQHASIIDAGINKLGDYNEWVSEIPAYTLAMVINPVVKLEWYRKNKPDKLQWAKDLFIRELHQYRGSRDINTPARPQAANSAESSDMAWTDSILGDKVFTRTPQARSLQAEVEAYLLDTQTGTSILHFWQENQLRYPTIFRLAMDIIPIQASAVPCERIFSSAKETMTMRRNRIKPELMEALQMLKFALKKGHELDFTKGTTKTEELEMMEKFIEDLVLVPEDMPAFVSSLLREDIATGSENV